MKKEIAFEIGVKRNATWPPYDFEGEGVRDWVLRLRNERVVREKLFCPRVIERSDEKEGALSPTLEVRSQIARLPSLVKWPLSGEALGMVAVYGPNGLILENAKKYEAMLSAGVGDKSHMGSYLMRMHDQEKQPYERWFLGSLDEGLGWLDRLSAYEQRIVRKAGRLSNSQGLN